MEINVRKYTSSDLPFMKEMLYEAVYWRKSDSTPSFDEAMSDSNILKVASDFGSLVGDVGVIAMSGSHPAGAAWIRYWSDENNMRGYIKEDIPVLVIGVHKDFRRQGIGQMLIEALVENALKCGISKISLCVSKDNHALKLYNKTGFSEFQDIGDSLIMILEQAPHEI